MVENCQTSRENGLGCARGPDSGRVCMRRLLITYSESIYDPVGKNRGPNGPGISSDRRTQHCTVEGKVHRRLAVSISPKKRIEIWPRSNILGPPSVRRHQKAIFAPRFAKITQTDVYYRSTTERRI